MIPVPTDRIIAAYSNWRIIERTFKTVQKAFCFIQDGSRKKVCVGEVPEGKRQGLLESAIRFAQRKEE